MKVITNIHDVYIHQRFKWFRRLDNKYSRAILRAHGVHHAKRTKEDGKDFGLLVVDSKYFKPRKEWTKKDEKIVENDIPIYFSEAYPFIEASEKTWGFYSTILKSWLLALKIIEIDKDGRINTSDVSHNNATIELGNLKRISGLRAGNRGLFFPVTSHAKMVEVTQMIIKGEEPTENEALKAKSDLKNAGVLVGGNLAVSNIDELNEALTAQILDDGYSDFWAAIHANEPCYAIFKVIAGEGLTESTLKWRLRKLTALAKKLKIIPNKRFTY